MILKGGNTRRVRARVARLRQLTVKERACFVRGAIDTLDPVGLRGAAVALRIATDDLSPADAERVRFIAKSIGVKDKDS